MEPHDKLIQLVPVLLAVALLFLLGHRARMRDRREYEEWWRRYREDERRTDLQHAWRARFVRYSHETEDEYVARFKSWLYDD